MEFSEKLLQEIDNDSKALLEELKLYCEEEELAKQPDQQQPEINNDQQQTMEKPDNNNNDLKNKAIIKKSNALLDRIKKNVKNQDYLLHGFGYHSQILYKLCTKFPLLGKTIGVPLIAITKYAVTHLPPLAQGEREKILELYTKLKGDKAAVEEKIGRLEKLQKPNKDQKEELMLLKKMSSELEMNLKRLEFNYKVSHIEEQKAKKDFQSNNGPRNYKM